MTNIRVGKKIQVLYNPSLSSLKFLIVYIPTVNRDRHHFKEQIGLVYNALF